MSASLPGFPAPPTSVRIEPDASLTTNNIGSIPTEQMETVFEIHDLKNTQESLPRWTGSFRFLDLPAELRVSVYQYLLPHDMLIGFDKIVWGPYGRKESNDLVASGYAQSMWKVTAKYGKNFNHNCEALNIKDGLSMFLVSKFVSNESRAVLYGSNTFRLTIDDIPHSPISMQSPLIFGPLGMDHRISLLRNLRSISINMTINRSPAYGHLSYTRNSLMYRGYTSRKHWVVKRHRARLEHFVSVIKQHADDANQSSLLRNLSIQFSGPFHPASEIRKFMLALEGLVGLRGIEFVSVTGVEPWFAQCIECCIKGEGGDVREVDWPVIRATRTKRKKDFVRRKKTVELTTRKWYNPVFDWIEFAERNGIEVPADIDQLYTTE